MTILVAALPLLAMAQKSLEVSVDSVGKLSTKIEEAQRFKIAELKISGPLNGADIKLLQQIVNRTKTNKKNPGECLVTSIDLSDARIMGGKEGIKTKNDELPGGLFSGAKMLTKVLIPNTTAVIGKNCFEKCVNLTEIPIPETVTTIESEAFEDCEKLSSISLPANLKILGNGVFEGCKVLTAISIPEDVKELGTDLFRSCENLTAVTLPDRLKSVGSNAFRDCKNLTGITLPKSVNEIGSSAFSHGSSQTSTPPTRWVTWHGSGRRLSVS